MKLLYSFVSVRCASWRNRLLLRRRLLLLLPIMLLRRLLLLLLPIMLLQGGGGGAGRQHEAGCVYIPRVEPVGEQRLR
jgi:hypothetical protein